MADYSDKDITLGRLRQDHQQETAARRGKGFFEDQAHNSALPSRSESLSRKTLTHLQGPAPRVSSYKEHKAPDFSTKARNERRAMNLKPKHRNKTRFDT